MNLFTDSSPTPQKAIAPPHSQKRSPFTSQKRSHFPHPKTAIASPTPQKRSPSHIPKKRSHLLHP
ncbi:MAG: hypothetical protein ACKPDM_19190 [Dolichospermum sp.]